VIGGLVGETPYDLRWRMFGTHIRVHPFYWVSAALYAWPYMDHFGFAEFLLVVACMFVSILLHEFGHIWMGRWFGTHGHIVFWCFGGLAYGSNALSNRWQRIAVLLAGPGIQLLLWVALYFGGPPLLELIDDRTVMHYVGIAYRELVWINLVWALLNLLPIWPLDGGQTSRELCDWRWPQGDALLSLQISVGLAVLLAVHALAAKDGRLLFWLLPTGTRPAVFFGVLALLGIQAMQEENVRDRWLDDRTSWE
jgi:stage IV sporulation protein FB